MEKNVLLKLLDISESPWEFELAGTKRSNGMPRFAGVRTHSFPYYHHDVQRGCWFPWSVAYLRIRGFTIDLSKRKMLSAAQTSKYLGIKILSKLKYLFNS